MDAGIEAKHARGARKSAAVESRQDHLDWADEIDQAHLDWADELLDRQGVSRA